MKSKMPVFLFVLFALWLGLEYFVLGPYSYVRVFDVGNIHIPQNIIVAKNFWKWGATYWYPYSLTGVDLMTEGYRTTNLSYMSLPYYLFPAWLAYPLFLLSVIFIGGYFTYRLGRDHLGLSEGSSLFAGLSVASVLGVWSNILISMLTLVLFSLNRIHEKSRTSISHGLWVIPLALLFASGSNFVFDHVIFVIIPAWFLFVLRKRDRRFWLLYFLFVCVVFAYYLPTLWAQFANGSYSYRSDLTIHLWDQFRAISQYLFLIHDYRHGHFVFPILWTIGISLAFWKFHFQNRFFNTALGVFILLVAIAFFLNVMASFLANFIGVFRGVRFNYTLESAPIFFALASAFALESFRPLSRRAVQIIFMALFLLTLYPKFWNFNRWLHGDSYTNLYEKKELKTLANQFRRDNLFRAGSATWGIFHPIVESYGLEAIDGYVHLYPRRYEFFMSALLNYENHSVGSRVQLYSKNLNWGLLSLANVKYILSDGSNGLFSEDYLTKNNLSEYFVPRWDSNENEKGASFLVQLTKKLGAIPNNFKARDDLYIIENKDVLPRFFIAKSPEFFENPESLLASLKKVSHPSFFKEYVFFEEEYEEAVSFRQGSFQSAEVRVLEYSPDRMQLSVALDGEGVLVASNSYSPFWRVFVNGVERKILPAYYAFWGVPLQKGESEIVFTYDPPYKFF